MNRTRASITSVFLAFALAACGGGNDTSSGGNGGDNGSGGSGGSGGSEQGGSGGNESGGSGGNESGGSGGNEKGGSGGNQSGGSGGSVKGGSGGGQGGSGGSAKGGSGGNQGGSGGGSGGSANGGTTTGEGGKGGATGGTSAAGGTAAGGTQATGGTTETGGTTTPAGPAVYVSTNGNCVSGSETTWKPGDISESTSNATVTVNDGSASQTWEGFGGSFNEMGWQALQALSQGDRDRAIELLFGTDGTRFDLGRIPMGASDFAVERYTCDEGGPDTNMEKFTIDRDKKFLIPFIQAALKVKSDIKFWASPWTPPTWMKTGPFEAITDDSATTKSNFDSGNMSNNDSYLAAYAQYFVKFVEAYKGEGINISLVAPQNEPNYALHYPSCLWSSSVYSTFVSKHLGPALNGKGVDIMLGTLSNSDSGKDVDLGNAALSAAKSSFKVVGVQWNVLEKVNSGTSFGGLPVWVSEHKCGNYPWNPSSGCGESGDSCPKYNSSKAPNDQAYGVESWKYLRNAITKGKVTGYSAWNMVLDTVGNSNDTHRSWNQNALLAVDTGAKKLVVTPTYCVFRHFSQFVVPGAKWVATSGGDAVAFKNPDGTVVAVMYNSGSANNNYVVSIAGKKLQFSMPGNGWATVVNKP